MANILSVELKKETNITIEDNQIKEHPKNGYDVYACCDELSCWIGYCNNLKELEEIINEDDLIKSIYENASEYELDCLMAALNCQSNKYYVYGTYRTANNFEGELDD